MTDHDKRKKAYQEFKNRVLELMKAVKEEDMNKQLIQLMRIADSLKDAKEATARICGGISQ